jgi:exodeoxyribonuclease V alpha subunit
MVRQSGLIIENTYKIKEGNSELKTDDNFVYEQYSSPEDLLSNLQNIDICDSIVLSNVKKGDLGVKNINKIIQSKQKHGKLCLEYGEYKYYVGDPVIMNKTNYRKGYFNGNIGKIVKSEGDLLYIDFSGETIILERDDFIYMSPAYAITIHKSQGSEYKTVYIILPNEPRGMLTRRLILTAITRAKERVYVWCINDACSYAITNRAEQPRLSLLGQRLKVAVDNI